MSETIIALIIIVFAGVWMVYIMSKLFDSIAWGRGIEDRFTMIVPIYSGTEDIEYVLGKAISARETGEGSFLIIAADFGADEETRRVCEIIAAEHDNVAVMSPSELESYFVELEEK